MREWLISRAERLIRIESGETSGRVAALRGPIALYVYRSKPFRVVLVPRVRTQNIGPDFFHKFIHEALMKRIRVARWARSTVVVSRANLEPDPMNGDEYGERRLGS